MFQRLNLISRAVVRHAGQVVPARIPPRAGDVLQNGTRRRVPSGENIADGSANRLGIARLLLRRVDLRLIAAVAAVAESAEEVAERVIAALLTIRIALLLSAVGIAAVRAVWISAVTAAAIRIPAIRIPTIRILLLLAVGVLLRVHQHVVGFVEFVHLFRRVGVVRMQIRMTLLGFAAIRALDFILAGGFGYTQHFPRVCDHARQPPFTGESSPFSLVVLPLCFFCFSARRWRNSL